MAKQELTQRAIQYAILDLEEAHIEIGRDAVISQLAKSSVEIRHDLGDVKIIEEAVKVHKAQQSH